MESPQPPSASPRKTVLVVDHDPQSLRIVDVSLRRAGFDVHTASDGTAAAESIDRVPPPDLVIADVDLPGIDGFELCRRTKASTRTGTIPFLFLARPHAPHKVRAFELGADDFLAKPVFVKEVIARVEALLQRHERERLSSRDLAADRATGSLADLSTIDLLQSIATNGKSGVLHLRSAGGAQGEVYFRRGAVVDAEVGRLSGADAVYRLLSWTDGHFDIEWRNIRRRDAVALPAPALLMEGMRRLDEWTRLTQQLPPLETVFEVDYRLLAERLADIPDEVNAILRLFDGMRSAMQVIDDCGLSDLDALTVIGKLSSEGLIRNITGKPTEDDKAGPDLEGWLGQPAAKASPRDIHAAPATDPDSRLRRAGDQPPAIRRTIESLPTPERTSSAERSAGHSAERATPANPSPDWHQRPADRDDREAEREDHDALIGSDHGGAPSFRPEEPAVVIPFPSASQSPPRQTLVSPTGGPAAAVAGEISNGVPAAGAAAPPPAAPPASPIAAAPAPATPTSVSIPRSTDPGLGPLPAMPLPAAPKPASPPPAVAPAATSHPELPAVPVAPAPAPLVAAPLQGAPHGRRDSAPRAAELPFDDSAARWMTEGDEIHTHRSRSEALDELALPSRFRGWALIGGAAILAVGAVTAVIAMRPARPPEPAAAAPAPAPPAVTSLPVVPPSSAPAAGSPPAPVPGAAPEEKAAPSEAHGQPAPAGTPAPAPGGVEAPAAEAPAASADFEHLLATCQTAFNSGRMKDATAACTVAVEANPESAKAIALLAHSEFNRSHRKEALAWAEKAIKIDPKLADAYVIIGGVQQDSGRNAEAKSAYRRYLELAPKGQYASDLRAILDSL